MLVGLFVLYSVLRRKIPRLRSAKKVSLSVAIADFQGDAALGFWGWPIAHDAPAVPAVVAIFRFVKFFEGAVAAEKGMLEGLSLGMGIATGTALAGQISTAQQSKIGVFGPIVNQGARLEGFSKMVGCKLCFDKETANQLRDSEISETCTIRHLGAVPPVGVDDGFDVFSLVTPEDTSMSADADITNVYERAWLAFPAGNWQAAQKLLAPLTGCDSPAAFLLNYIELRGPTAPSEEHCVIHLEKKKQPAVQVSASFSKDCQDRMGSDCISASGLKIERQSSSRTEIEATFATRSRKHLDGNPKHSKEMSRGEFEMAQNGGWIIVMTHQEN